MQPLIDDLGFLFWYDVAGSFDDEIVIFRLRFIDDIIYSSDVVHFFQCSLTFQVCRICIDAGVKEVW